jgi:nucleotide-binding universal stress UspA family protein
MGSSVFVGFQTILVAYDATSHSEHAVDVAFSLAEDRKAKVYILAVIVPPEPAGSRAELNAVLDDMRERYEHSFIPVRDRAQQKNIELETDIVVGHPAEQILHRADTIQASLIVIGRRSHSTFHRWMLSSTSERVLKYARCPVMVVHHDAESQP